MAKKKVPVTPEGTFSYPHLFAPYSESGKYEVALIFPPGADTKELEALVEEAANAKWPKKNGKSTRPKNFHHPLRDNAEKEGSPGYVEGGTFARFKTNTRPKVVGRDPTEAVTEEDIYPGARGKVSYSAFAYDKGGGVGVSLLLVNVQKTGDGEPLAGVRSDPEDDFDDLGEDPELAAALGE